MELTKDEIAIVRKVCKHYNLKPDDIYCHCRRREIVEARHLLILLFVIEFQHEIKMVTKHFGALNTSNFYHGLHNMVYHTQYSKQYRDRLSELFPLNGIAMDDFMAKVMEKHQTLENERY